MQDFKGLKIWQRAHRLTIEIYVSTRSFPWIERYSITSQIQRAAVSICANMAEGCARKGDADFRRFLQIALGSANEVECYLLLARDLGYLDPPAFAGLENKVQEVRRMLISLVLKLRASGF